MIEKELEKNEKPMDYFPYTHGDNIERQRIIMKE